MSALGRYARQIAVSEIGPAGQKKLGSAVVRLSGDPLIIETAADYLAAAGVQVAQVKTDGTGLPSRGAARLNDETTELVAWAGEEDCGISFDGCTPVKSSPMTSSYVLASAGMLLAVGVTQRILGIAPADWSISLSAFG